MAVKAWFDYSTYMSNKLMQMQALEPNAGWNMTKLNAAFEKAGFVGDTGAQAHFLKYGHHEDVSPNKLFDPTYYYQAKALQFYTSEQGGSIPAETVKAHLDEYGVKVAGIIKGYGMDAWTHYIKYGTAEGINPTNDFDTSDYMAAKLAALQAAEPDKNWTEESMNAAFKKAGLNALEHYLQYAGKSDVEVPAGSTYPVPEDEQIDAGNGGETFNLTTNADTLTGTDKDDVFVAGETGGQKTLTAGDSLNGGDGTDTLKVSTSRGEDYSGFVTKNIEVLDATSDGGAQTFDLSGSEGLTTLRSTNSNSATTFNHVGSLANVEAVKLTENNAGVAPDITVSYEDSVVIGSEDSVSLTVNSSKVGVVTLGKNTDANGGIETLALTAKGGASTIAQIDSDITTLNFAGDQNVEVTRALNTTVKTIDASAAKGGLNVAVAGNDVTFTGGAGNDEIDFGDSLNNKDSVKGGAGEDRIIAEKSGLVKAAANISEVEIVRVADVLDNTDDSGNTEILNAGKFADATTFELAEGYAGGARIDDFTASQTRVDILAGESAGTLFLDEAATEFTLGMGTKGVNQAVTADVDFNDKVATLNVESKGDPKHDDFVNTLNVTTTALKTVNITGDEDLVLTSNAGAVATIAAGDATGDLTLTKVALATTGATITTGSGDDKVKGDAGKDKINTGAGADTVYGSEGADEITLGDGADTVVYQSLAQSNSTSMDTVTDFVDKTDKIDVQSLMATKYVGSKASFDLAQGALVGNGVISAVFDSSTGRFWVDMDGNGTLDNNDFRVTLENVTTLSDSSVITGTGPTKIKPGDNGPFEGVTTLYEGTSEEVLAAATINGNEDTDDTLRVTDQLAAVNFAEGDPKLKNINNIILEKGAADVTVHDEDDVKVTNNLATGVAAEDASTVTLGTGEGQSYTTNSENLGVQTVTVNGENQTVETAKGDDDITINAAGSKVSTGDGDDTFTVSDIASLDGANFDGGADDDTLDLSGIAAGGDLSKAGATFKDIENLTLAGDWRMTVDQYNSFGTAVTGADSITFTDAGATATIAAGSDVDTYNLNKAGNVVDASAIGVATTINGAAGNDTVIAAPAVTANLTFDGGAGNNTVELALAEDNHANVALANVTNVQTLKISGDFALTGEEDGENPGVYDAATVDTGDNTLSTIDLSELTGGALLSLGALAPAGGLTVNAVNGATDSITLTTGAAKVTANLDSGDSAVLAAALTTANAATVLVSDNGISTTTTSVTVNAAFTAAAKSLLVGVDGTAVDTVDGFEAGKVGALYENYVLMIDLDKDGHFGGGDVSVTFDGPGTADKISLSGVTEGAVDVVISA